MRVRKRKNPDPPFNPNQASSTHRTVTKGATELLTTPPAKKTPVGPKLADHFSYELNPLMSRMIDVELQDVMIKMWQSLPDEPKSDADKLVAEKFRTDVGDTFRSVLGLNIAKRLLNIFNKMSVKIQFSSVPPRANLRSFLKKYSFVSFKRIVGTTRSFHAQVKTIQDFDRLCTAKNLYCGLSKLDVTPHYRFSQRPDKLKTNFDKSIVGKPKTEVTIEKESIKQSEKKHEAIMPTEVETGAKTAQAQAKPATTNAQTKPPPVKLITQTTQTKTTQPPNETKPNETVTLVKNNVSTNSIATKTIKQVDTKTPATPVTLANSKQDNPNKPTTTTQAKPNTPTNTTQGKPNTPANIVQTKPNTPAYATQGKPKTPANTTQAKPNTPANTTQAKPNTPANTTQAKPNAPASTMQAKSNTPVKVTQGKPNTPVNTTQGTPNTPASTTQAKCNTPVKATQGKPNSPANATKGKLNTPVNTTQAKPNTPTNSTQVKTNTAANVTQAKTNTKVNPQQKANASSANKTTPVKSTPTQTKQTASQVKPTPQHLKSNMKAKVTPTKAQETKKKLPYAKCKRNPLEGKGDFEELDDHDILALMSGGIVLDECSGSEED